MWIKFEGNQTKISALLNARVQYGVPFETAVSAGEQEFDKTHSQSSGYFLACPTRLGAGERCRIGDPLAHLLKSLATLKSRVRLSRPGTRSLPIGGDEVSGFIYAPRQGLHCQAVASLPFGSSLHPDPNLSTASESSAPLEHASHA